ncbi:MAG: AAA family ATPase [Acidimicrobiales bacterium]|nr:AAA family ATPase [Acidimicrobiales bacterium]
MTRQIVITGLMGVGKTTTATAVAKRLSLPYRDSDDDIHRLLGRSGRQVAEQLGVDELHRLEAAVLLGALASPQQQVITAAASTVEDPLCRATMGHTAVTVVLTAPLDTVIERMRDGRHRRSIDRAELERIASRRDPLFNEVADMIVAVDRPADEVADDIVLFLQRD